VNFGAFEGVCVAAKVPPMPIKRMNMPSELNFSFSPRTSLENKALKTMVRLDVLAINMTSPSFIAALEKWDGYYKN